MAFSVPYVINRLLGVLLLRSKQREEGKKKKKRTRRKRRRRRQKWEGGHVAPRKDLTEELGPP